MTLLSGRISVRVDGRNQEDRDLLMDTLLLLHHTTRTGILVKRQNMIGKDKVAQVMDNDKDLIPVTTTRRKGPRKIVLITPANYAEAGREKKKTF